ncbi:MAG TPA: DUF4383 domain-containing protein [Mycobacteriales bacterium]|nr:DUF4383 domain-containing protein [Mycobacteriales bacterium]
MRLQEELPVDHQLAGVYRFGAGLVGSFLIAFGILGLLHNPDVVGRTGVRVLGLSTDGLLSGVSVLVGLILLAAAWIGGNVASVVNCVFGMLFLLNGVQGLALLRTSLNILAFEVRNVIFSFLVGLALLFFGLYGRVSGGLTEENPYWRARHGLTAKQAHERLEQSERIAAGEARAERERTERERAERERTGSEHASGEGQRPRPW